jgi:hypothetical protein
MILLPNSFNRVPVFSYIIRGLPLPISYELIGRVKIVDADNNIVNRAVEVFIGGYSVLTELDGTFYLRFSSPSTNEIFVAIRYISPECNFITTYELVKIKNGEYCLKKEFIIRV